LIAVMEVARRAFPAVDRRWQQHNLERWERWLAWQSAGKVAAFEAATPLRR
jgi:hypothetical protein